MDPGNTKLAGAWRALGAMGLVDSVFNHISMCERNVDGNATLTINRFGVVPSLFDPSCFERYPFSVGGRDHTNSDLRAVNPDGWTLHSLIHSSRTGDGVAIHLHAAYATAVANSSDGLLPLSQASMEFVGVTPVVDYGGLFREASLDSRLREVFARGGCALLRSHGLVAVGQDVEEAFYLAIYLEEACRVQVLTLGSGRPFVLPDDGVVQETQERLVSDRATVAPMVFEGAVAGGSMDGHLEDWGS